MRATGYTMGQRRFDPPPQSGGGGPPIAGKLAQPAQACLRGRWRGRACLWTHAPSTMLRMVPLPRFTGEDFSHPLFAPCPAPLKNRRQLCSSDAAGTAAWAQ